MRTYNLLPSYFRSLGFVLAVPGLILGFLFLFYGCVIPGFAPPVDKDNTMLARFDNYTNELALTLVIIGIIFIAFSKLKKEDELTAQLRLNALYWAILINYLALIAGALISLVNSLGGEPGISSDIIDFNLVMPLLVFLARFYYLLYRNRNEYYVAPLRFLPYNPFNKIAKIVAMPCIALFIACAIYTTFFRNVVGQTPSWYRYADPVYYIMPVILLVWIYSKERTEDEYINSLRLQAMQIAIYVNCVVLLVANFIYYSLSFLYFEIFELSIIPLIFVAIFQYRLYRLSKQTEVKKNNNLNVNLL